MNKRWPRLYAGVHVDDEFTKLDMSPQQKARLRKRKHGYCAESGCWRLHLYRHSQCAFHRRKQLLKMAAGKRTYFRRNGKRKPACAWLHDMDVKSLDSAEQTKAAIKVFTLLKAQLTAVRKGDRTDLAKVAIREIERCDQRLADLDRHLKRFGRRNTIPA